MKIIFKEVIQKKYFLLLGSKEYNVYTLCDLAEGCVEDWELEGRSTEVKNLTLRESLLEENIIKLNSRGSYDKGESWEEFIDLLSEAMKQVHTKG